jgi:leucyl aminopeptidase
MNFELTAMDADGAAHQPCDVLLLLLASDVKPAPGVLSTLVEQAGGDLESKAGSLLDMYRPNGLSCKRLVLVQSASGNAHDMREAVHKAVTLIATAKPHNIILYFEKTPSSQALRVALTTLAEASYRYTTTKGEKTEGRSLENVKVAMPDTTALNKAFDVAVAAVHGIEFAKEWANRPANHATPTLLAQAAQSLEKFPKIKCRVLDAKAVTKLNMGAFLAVAQGSAQPLQFIVLRYNVHGKGRPPVVLVGKGITFDSGGICIKPSPDMDEMKFDMSGAASVLGVFHALAMLQPDISVVGLIPACENLPSGHAIKPGDVVTSMNGLTIEILNTDAEGRLVLCDALVYAQRFKPHAVIDIATLTGACVIALGKVRSGLFSNNTELSAALQAAGESSQDLCWPMPLDEDYAEGLKSNFADLANVAGRPGGVITAAKFLQRFADKFSWAHLDIAGTAWKSGDAKGATGRPVGLLLDYLLSQDTKA